MIVLALTAGILVHAQTRPAGQSAPDQKTEGQPLENLRKSPVSLRAAEKIRNLAPAKGQKWALVGTRYRESVPGEKFWNFTDLVFGRGGIFVSVTIAEYGNVDHARGMLSIAVNARVERTNGFGDEGQKVYSVHGKFGFANLWFRQGKYSVFIDCRDNEKLADEVAKAVSESIAEVS